MKHADHLKIIAEEFFWLVFALICAWYAAVSWPLHQHLPILAHTLLYLPCMGVVVFLLKEGFHGYARKPQLIVLSFFLLASLLSLTLLTAEEYALAHRQQLPVLAQALETGNYLALGNSAQLKAPLARYFQLALVLDGLLLALIAFQFGRLSPKK